MIQSNAKACEAYNKAIQYYVYGAEEQCSEWESFVCDMECMAMMLIRVGFPAGKWEITVENYHEVYRRIYMVEHTTGAFRMRFDSNQCKHEQFFTVAEVRSFIGFKVNAGNKTNLQFDKSVCEALRWQAQAEISNDKVYS